MVRGAQLRSAGCRSWRSCSPSSALPPTPCGDQQSAPPRAPPRRARWARVSATVPSNRPIALPAVSQRPFPIDTAAVVLGEVPQFAALERTDGTAAQGPWSLVVRRRDGSLGRHGAVITYPVSPPAWGHPVRVGRTIGAAVAGGFVWPLAGKYARIRSDLPPPEVVRLALATTVVRAAPAIHPLSGYRIAPAVPYRSGSIHEIRYHASQLGSSRCRPGRAYLHRTADRRRRFRRPPLCPAGHRRGAGARPTRRRHRDDRREPRGRLGGGTRDDCLPRLQRRRVRPADRRRAAATGQPRAPAVRPSLASEQPAAHRAAQRLRITCGWSKRFGGRVRICPDRPLNPRDVMPLVMFPADAPIRADGLEPMPIVRPFGARRCEPSPHRRADAKPPRPCRARPKAAARALNRLERNLREEIGHLRSPARRLRPRARSHT